MATYEEIYGKRVEVLDADPTLTSAYEGQVWYNTTTGTLKSVVSSASFASGTSLSTGRSDIMGNVGTQTASLIGGGGAPPSGSGVTTTEEYNGLGWASGGARSTSFFRVTNFGTQTAAIGFGGYSPSPSPTAPARYSISTEEYDGSSWTGGGSFPNGIQTAGGTGTLTAGLQASGIFGPYTTAPSAGWKTECNEYDGSSWTNGGVMPAGRDISTDIGTQTAALMTCGRAAGGSPDLKNSFYYDGSSWTASTDAPTAGHGCNGFGTQTSAILCGGATPSRSTQSVQWDGTSWTSAGSLGTAKVYGISAGTTTAGMTCAGATAGAPAGQTATEEFQISINTVTPAAWSSGGALNTARSQGTGAGTMTAGWVVGGQEPALSNKTEEYDGSSWTAVNTIGMSSRLLAGAGPQTAAFATGGFIPGPSVTAAAYNYNGTTWTAGAAQPVGTYGQGSLGTQTAGLIFGGSAPTTSNYLNTSYEYDGEGWTASPGNMNTGRHYIAGSGIQTAGLSVGGDEGPPGKSNKTEEYNGSTWTASSTTPDVRRGAGLSGPQTAALYFGGSGDPGARTTTFGYDGTSWSSRPSIATSRKLIEGGSKNGTATSAWMAGGQLESPGAVSALTEEYAGETTTIAAKTLTTS